MITIVKNTQAPLYIIGDFALKATESVHISNLDRLCNMSKEEHQEILSALEARQSNQEDWAELANHVNFNVRLLVAKQGYCLNKLANDSSFGLGGSVFSKDIDRAVEVASKIETGMVFINQYTGSRPDLPFGGTKRSGYGRELAAYGMNEFVNKKLIYVGE